MAVQLSRTEALGLRDQAMRAIAHAKTVVHKADEAVGKVVTAAVTGGSAFAFGVAQGRYGAIEVMGIPADLGGAVALHALGFLGVGGKSSEYLHAAGNGALAVYASTLGRGIGVEWKTKALSGGGASALPPPSGAAASGRTLSDAELARMSRGG